MAVKQPRLGVAHLTVVPTNFTPKADAHDEAEMAADTASDDK